MDASGVDDEAFVSFASMFGIDGDSKAGLAALPLDCGSENEDDSMIWAAASACCIRRFLRFRPWVVVGDSCCMIGGEDFPRLKSCRADE